MPSKAPPETRQRRRKRKRKKAATAAGTSPRRKPKGKGLQASGGPGTGTWTQGPAGIPNKLGPRQWAGLLQGPLVAWPKIEIKIGPQSDNRAPSGAVAIATLLAESDGQTDVPGDNGESWGAWQIHLPDHPDVTKQCATDAICSSRAALRISGGGRNFTPWTQFNNGEFRKHLPEAIAAWANPDKEFVVSKWEETYTGPFVENKNPLDAGIAILGALVQGATWIRVAMVVAGAVLMFIGIRRMMK